MSSIVQKIYWKSPYFVKNWIASINAWKLDHQRYGREYQQIIDEIAEHDKWSTEKFLEYQSQQLCSLIQHAAAKVPYYRKIFSEAGIDPKSITGPSELQRLPILEKEIVRSDPKSLVDETLDIGKLLVSRTSGTTGTPVNLYRNVWLNCVAFAYNEARCHGVAGMERRVNPSVSLGGHPVAAAERTKPPFWVYNRRWKQLYMSSYHLSPKYLGYYVDELRKFKADYIAGYPSSVYAIAQYIVENDLEPVPFKACFTTAEILFDYQRDIIKKAFGCKTYNQYGCGEQVVFAAECPAGLMHLSPEVGLVEVVDDNDRPVPVGESGHLICTNLINRVQPFIRYRVGDVGSLRLGQCPCGSPLPMLGAIEGRTGDILVTRDGRRISYLGQTFYGAHGIAMGQIIQDDFDRYRIRIVPSKDYVEADGQALVNRLTQYVGEARIEVELVEEIERTSAGKFKPVICNLAKK